MSLDPTAALYKAVSAALIADPTLAATVEGRVYSSWEAGGKTFPLIRLSIPTVEDYEHSCGVGSEATVRVHCFADRGPAAAALIAARVRNLLDNDDLAIDGVDLVGFEYVRTLNTNDPADPGKYVAVVQFLATTTTKED